MQLLFYAVQLVLWFSMISTITILHTLVKFTTKQIIPVVLAFRFWDLLRLDKDVYKQHLFDVVKEIW